MCSCFPRLTRCLPFRLRSDISPNLACLPSSLSISHDLNSSSRKPLPLIRLPLWLPLHAASSVPCKFLVYWSLSQCQIILHWWDLFYNYSQITSTAFWMYPNQTSLNPPKWLKTFWSSNMASIVFHAHSPPQCHVSIQDSSSKCS